MPTKPLPGVDVDEREIRICEASYEMTKLMIAHPHISGDEFLMAILRIAPRLVKRPRRRKG